MPSLAMAATRGVEDLDRAYKLFKLLADVMKTFVDEDLISIRPKDARQTPVFLSAQQAQARTACAALARSERVMTSAET